MSDFDNSTDDEIKGKPVNPSTLDASIVDILQVYGSLCDCNELTPSEISRADLRTDKLISVRQFKKGRWQLDRYPTSLSSLRVFKVPRSSGSGVSQASVILGVASKQHYDISPTIFIDTPITGAVIELTDKIYITKYFVYHKIVEGETVKAIVKNITDDTDLSVIQELNYQPYTIGQVVYSGDLLKIENGKALKISGNATNSEVVALTLTGAINATKTLELAKAGNNIIVGFDTEFKIDGHGAVKIEAKAMSETGRAEYVSQVEIKKPNWIEVLYTENDKPINVELDYIIKFDDGTRIRAKLKNGSDYIAMVPFSPFTIEFLPTKEKQKELDELYKKLDKELKDKVTEVEQNSAQLKKEWEAHPWYMKKIVGDLYAIKGAAYWVYETLESMWTLVKGVAVSAVKTSTWIAEYQLHKEKLLIHIILSNKEGITEETAQLERMAKEANDDVTEIVETAKTLYYLAHDDRIGSRLKEFVDNYFTALSPQEQHEFVTRYGIDIVLIFVGGSGAAILGVKNAAKISQYLTKMAEILKVFKYKFKPKVKGKVNKKNTYDKIIKPVKIKQAKLHCFKKGDSLNKKFKGTSKKLDKGYKKQLRNQETGLNNMTVGEYRKGRELYSKNRRSGSGAEKVQKAARKNYQGKIHKRLEDSIRNKNKGLSKKEINKMASKQTTEIMSELAALHDPDLIAAGKKVVKLGNKRINSSIGSQWANQIPGREKGASRIKDLDKKVEAAYKKYGDNAKMNVKLSVCK